MTLTEFLLERIREDELLATNAIASRFPTRVTTPQWDYDGNPSGAFGSSGVTIGQASSWDYNTDNPAGADGGRFARHIVNWDPARVLVECQAKRQLIQRYEYSPTCRCLRYLGLPYAGHPEFRPEWAP